MVGRSTGEVEVVVQVVVGGVRIRSCAITRTGWGGLGWESAAGGFGGKRLNGRG